MAQIIGGIIQLIILILKDKFEKDKDKRAARKEMHDEGIEAIKSRDSAKLHAVLDRMRSS